MNKRERLEYIGFQCAAAVVLGLLWSGCVFLMGYWGIGL